jgi:hypothetical protein
MGACMTDSQNSDKAVYKDLTPAGSRMRRTGKKADGEE